MRLNNKILKLLTKIANNRRASNALTYGGITLVAIGNILAIYGAYYRGVNNGVEARDEYYYQKEIKDYEQNRETT